MLVSKVMIELDTRQEEIGKWPVPTGFSLHLKIDTCMVQMHGAVLQHGAMCEHGTLSIYGDVMLRKGLSLLVKILNKSSCSNFV